jgi:hypothetical protein
MGDVRQFILHGTLGRHPAVEAWLASTPDDLRKIARHWFDVMRSCGPDVTEILHDEQPTACVNLAAFCYVDVFSDHVNVGFFPGSSLDDPAGLLEGSGKYMRHTKIRPGTAVDEAALRKLIVAAYHRVKGEQE